MQEAVIPAIARVAQSSHPHLRPANRRWLRWALLGSFVLLAAWLRALHSGQPSFWIDEGASVQIARMPWREFWHLMWEREGNMVLYYLLLRGWIHLGSSEAVVRGLGALFSVATVPAMYLLSRDLLGSRKAGIIAALLLAINTYHVTYAQEARSYSLLVFLCTLATWFFARAVRSGRQRDWNLWAATIILGIYSHLFAALVLIAQVACLAMLGRRPPFAKLLSAGWKMALALVPVAAFVLFRNSTQLIWVPKPRLHDLLILVRSFAGYRDLLVGAMSVLAGFAVAKSFRRQSSANPFSWETWHLRLLVSWLLLPIALTYGFSLVAQPIWAPRFLIIALPPFLLLVAYGVSRLGRVAGVVVLVTLLVTSVKPLGRYYRLTNERRDNWRAAVPYVLAHASKDDAIIFYHPSGRMTFEYYSSRGNYPPTPQFVPYSNRPDPADDYFSPIPVRDLMPRLEGHYRRVWLVLNNFKNPDHKPDGYALRLETGLQQHYDLTEATYFTEIDVLQWDAKN